MQEKAINSRLIPQFSIRWLFAVTAIVAMAFSVVGLAVRGSGWAVGVSFAMASLAILVLAYALMFAVVWVFSAVCGRFSIRRNRAGLSPFGALDGSANQTASPFLSANDGTMFDDSSVTIVEAVLVETPEEPPRPGLENSAEDSL
jgi:hypothetical protein